MTQSLQASANIIKLSLLLLCILGVLRAMKTARINLSLGEKLFSLYLKKIISSLQYKEVHFSSSGMYEHLLASSNQQLFPFHKNLLISYY
jgi:hypothetical protein